MTDAVGRGPVTAWRVFRAVHLSTAFSGSGAARHGGRFNPAGRAAVYAADSLALALLETLVHLKPEDSLARFAAVRLNLDPVLIEDAGPDLPPDWRTDEAATRRFGGEWLASGRSAALRVPPAVLPFPTDEANYVLNPAHPNFGTLILDPPVLFRFDPRLFAAGG